MNKKLKSHQQYKLKKKLNDLLCIENKGADKEEK